MPAEWRHKLAQKVDDPDAERKLHAWVAFGCLLLVPPSALWLANSVPYIVALSVFAILYAAISSYQAAKAEENVLKRLDELEKKL